MSMIEDDRVVSKMMALPMTEHIQWYLWDRAALEKFASDATIEMRRQDEVIATLKQELRVALDAYRNEVISENNQKV